MDLAESTERQGAGIALVGNFNPAIFNPDWLEKHALISSRDAGMANVSVIHPEIANFRTGDLVWEITDTKFSLLSESEPFVRLPDIVVDLFVNVLSETPLKSAGINWFHHFRVRDRKQQIALGRKLAPIEPWGLWGETMLSDKPMMVGGLRSLTMQETYANFEFQGRAFKGHRQVSIEPSVKIAEGLGIYMNINDHYELVDQESSGPVAELVNSRFDESLEAAWKVVATISELAGTL